MIFDGYDIIIKLTLNQLWVNSLRYILQIKWNHLNSSEKKGLKPFFLIYLV